MVDHRPALLAAQAAIDGLGPADLTRSVAACPGWDVERLVRHLARVQGWVAGVVRTLGDDQPPDAPRPAPDEALPAFAHRMSATLVDALDGADPDRMVSGLPGTDRVPVAFWRRRMTHETTLHHWDLLQAVDPPRELAIDPDVAQDGVDEVLEVLLPLRFDLSAFGPAGETMHLHATDGPGEWLLTFSAEGPVQVTRAHAKGDVAVRASTGDLLLTLWGRRDPSQLDVFGDADVLARYRAAARY